MPSDFTSKQAASTNRVTRLLDYLLHLQQADASERQCEALCTDLAATQQRAAALGAEREQADAELRQARAALAAKESALEEVRARRQRDSARACTTHLLPHNAPADGLWAQAVALSCSSHSQRCCTHAWPFQALEFHRVESAQWQAELEESSSTATRWRTKAAAVQCELERRAAAEAAARTAAEERRAEAQREAEERDAEIQQLRDRLQVGHGVLARCCTLSSATHVRVTGVH